MSLTTEKKNLNSLALGISSLNKELNLEDLQIKGFIPEWLNGSFIRNSPSKFEFEKDCYNHWFDGIAMFHKFKINNGKVNYKNKFVQSSEYLHGIKSGKIEYSGFATPANKNVLQKIGSIFNHEEHIPNANVNITTINGDYIAMTEVTQLVKFNPENLETLGVYQHNDELKGQVSTAHPHYDFDRKEFYNLMLDFSKTSHYIFYRIKENSTKREIVASIPVNNPAYVHYFAMTKNYLVLVECPFVGNTLSMILTGKPFIENYKWKGENGTNFHVIEKDTGKTKKVFSTEAFFTFHGVNAYEEKGQIVLDIPSFKDSTLVQDLYISNLKKDIPVSVSDLVRYRLDFTTGKVDKEKLSDKFIELPRIDYKNKNGNDYKYFYSNGRSKNGILLDEIIKFNVKTGENIIWFEEGCIPSEPVFIKKSDSLPEDEGVVLSIVLNNKKGNSFLLILDAKNLEELSRIEVPHHIPLGFHGQFLKNV